MDDESNPRVADAADCDSYARVVITIRENMCPATRFVSTCFDYEPSKYLPSLEAHVVITR